MTRQPAPKEAAAAAALAGAAAVGAKLAKDRLSGDDDPSRAYRLERDEYVPDGIRRIARGRIDRAYEELDGASKRKLGEAVHDARKQLKRLRAVVRLARPALGDETYRRENAAFRDAGRRLATARDARVLLETLDGLRKQFADELPHEATDGLRDRLEAEHEQAEVTLREDEQAIAAVLTSLTDARTRVASWQFADDGFDALAPGLRRIYRRGRRRMRAAEAEPSPENLHEWRKRVKDLWHAAEILHPARPKRMEKLARSAHDLSDLLGEDHDLAVLTEYAQARPQLFASDADRQALLAVIERRRSGLQKRAFGLGRRIHGPGPNRFVRSVKRDWRRKPSAKPQPAAAT